MYEDNEYGKINTEQQQNPYVTPPQGMYTDYTGYGSARSNRTAPAPKKKSRAGRIVAACIALTLVGLLVGTGVSYAYFNAKGLGNGSNKTATEQNADTQEKKDERVELAKSENDTDNKVETALPTTAFGGEMNVSQIVTQCLPSVVAITNYGVQEIQSMWGNFVQDTKGAGSGVIIGQTDTELLILTNYHVVENSKQLSVVFSWEEDVDDIEDDDIIYATIKDYDEGRDIAVVAIKTADLPEEVFSKICVATVGSSDDLSLGEQVVAIGNALGYGQSVTTGIVSALNRHISDNNGTMDPNPYIQTDAAINPGNSGGALFNMKGELVGINTAMIAGNTVENMGYAIPISEITGEVESMMNQETRDIVEEDNRGYLGISIVDVTAQISETYGLPQGIYISSVDPGSGAEKAGLEKEDIITAVNGRSVKTSEELRNYLDRYSVGETVTVTVSYRSDDDYASKDVEVTLGENPNKESSSTPEEVKPDNNEEGQDGSNGLYSFEIPFPFSFGN